MSHINFGIIDSLYGSTTKSNIKKILVWQKKEYAQQVEFKEKGTGKWALHKFGNNDSFMGCIL